MELILVMTILAIAVSITAPALSSFFRGRTLDSEARRMLSLARHGQSRAVAEGVPMELWFDSANQTYGLEAEASFEPTDAKAVNIQMDSDMQLQVVSLPTAQNPVSLNSAASPRPEPKSNHSNLPRIRFLADGSIAETSPQMIQLTGRDGSSRWLVQSRNHLGYEIRAQK
jgi:Tfp pilus assembly protein FimT